MIIYDTILNDKPFNGRFLLLHSCGRHDEHREISFFNKSGKEIGYQISFGKKEYISEDTIFLCNKSSDNFIANNSSYILDAPSESRGWETELNDRHYIHFIVLDGNKFRIFFSEPCDTIRKNVPILHTYRLTLKDLEHMNWTVVYPPEKQVYYDGDLNP